MLKNHLYHSRKPVMRDSVNCVENPNRFHKNQVRYPCSGLHERLSSVCLTEIVACYKANQHVCVNGAHVFSECADERLPSTHPDLSERGPRQKAPRGSALKSHANCAPRSVYRLPLSTQGPNPGRRRV